MATVEFTANLLRQYGREVGVCEAQGVTVAEALEAVFARHPQLRGYVLDDQGAVRKHVAVFLDGEPVRDRDRLTDALGPDGEVFVMQALSGG